MSWQIGQLDECFREGRIGPLRVSEFVSVVIGPTGGKDGLPVVQDRECIGRDSGGEENFGNLVSVANITSSLG